MYTLSVLISLVLSSQYSEKVFVCGFVILIVLFLFVAAAFICMFCIFMTYSTSYCYITNLWIHGMYVRMYTGG
jgi:hypothetical protein